MGTSGELLKDSAGAGSRAARNKRFARLYEDLRRPSRAMLRRTFGSAFADDEIEDLYASAWVGVIRALDRRHEQLDEDEMRRYVLAAVANQANRELRRRGRRPTAPLEAASAVPDASDLPDQIASRAEDDRLTRDVLSSLPPRRRSVMMLRYGWQLAPDEVCSLVEGLSPRAYRKEITRGVNEVARKMSQVESGEWCEAQAPLLHAFAAGTADAEQRRQAEQHLSHCRACATHVGRLGSRLHELGAAIAVGAGGLGALDTSQLSLTERFVACVDRMRDGFLGLAGRGGDAMDRVDGAVGSVTAGGAGAGGLMAKAAGAGVTKTVAACLGVGAAAATCVAAGVVPAIRGGSHDHGSARIARVLASEAPADDESEGGGPATTPSASEPAVDQGGAAAEAPAGSDGEADSNASDDRPHHGLHPDPPAGDGDAQGAPLAGADPSAEEFGPVGDTAPPPVSPPAYSSGGGSTGSSASSGGASSGGSSNGSSGGSTDFGP